MLTTTPQKVTLDGSPVQNHVPLSISDARTPLPLSTEQVRIIRGAPKVQVNTTDYWNRQIGYIPDRGDIIVYSDYNGGVDGSTEGYVPGVKIGDGSAYCIDLPFITDAIAQQLLAHIADTTVHVTEADRDFWDNKLNCEANGETLILTRM